jgi:hypothetical protein
MDQTAAPFELISYRGLLKSLDGFKKNAQAGDNNPSLIAYGLKVAQEFVLFHVFFAISVLESFLFYLVDLPIS